MDNSSGDGGKSGASPSPNLRRAQLAPAPRVSRLLASAFAELAASSSFPPVLILSPHETTSS